MFAPLCGKFIPETVQIFTRIGPSFIEEEDMTKKTFWCFSIQCKAVVCCVLGCIPVNDRWCHN